MRNKHGPQASHGSMYNHILLHDDTGDRPTATRMDHRNRVDNTT